VRPIRRRALIIVVGTAALLSAPGLAARPLATPTRYRFSFAVAEKPDYTKGFPAVRVSGSGSGGFAIIHRQIDRDGTVFWDLVDAGGTITLSKAGRLLVRAVVVGGRFGIEQATGGLERHVLLTLRLTFAGRFRCSAAAAQLGLQDLPQTHGNLDGMQFHACTTDLQWSGKAPALIVHVTPT
jgi:hypothetical protein